MENIIKIKDLSFVHNEKLILSNINLNINKNTFNSLIGPNGSGKTLLAKLITDYSAGVDEDKNNNTCDIKQKVSYLSYSTQTVFTKETIEQELKYRLSNLDYSKKKISACVNKVVNLFDIKNILKQELSNLSKDEETLITIICTIIDYPKILIIDGFLSKVDNIKKEKILKILKKMVTEKKLTIINITNDGEELLLSDNIIVMNNGKIEVIGKTKDILKNEKLFDTLGLELPFMADLSHKLISYELIDDIKLDMNEMIDELWK